MERTRPAQLCPVPPCPPHCRGSGVVLSPGHPRKGSGSSWERGWGQFPGDPRQDSDGWWAVWLFWCIPPFPTATRTHPRPELGTDPYLLSGEAQAPLGLGTFSRAVISRQGAAPHTPWGPPDPECWPSPTPVPAWPPESVSGGPGRPEQGTQLLGPLQSPVLLALLCSEPWSRHL